MELKDKLNLLWKFLFLAVFTYGVISFTCYLNCSQSGCEKSGSYASCKQSRYLHNKECSSAKLQCEKDKKQCELNCNKPGCKKKVSE